MSDIFVTIDTEFSAGSMFKDPANGKPVTEKAVHCTIGKENHGLEFLLTVFRQYRIQATFFVEAAHTLVMGHDTMKPVVEAIAGAGHDIQLHIHPLWLSAHKHHKKVIDSMAKLSFQDALFLLETGVEAFEIWGLPCPVAFRAGNLQMGLSTYKALEKAGILLSSSVGMAIFLPEEKKLHIKNSIRTIGACTEIPVLAYSEMKLPGRSGLKNLTITGSGQRELTHITSQAVQKGVQDIVLLTHPFEYIKRKDKEYKNISVNRVNKKKLVHFCQFINECNDLHSKTFSEKAREWSKAGDGKDVELSAKTTDVVFRMVQNFLNDRLPV